MTLRKCEHGVPQPAIECQHCKDIISVQKILELEERVNKLENICRFLLDVYPDEKDSLSELL